MRTWVGFGIQYPAVPWRRSVPIWCAAAAKWCPGSDKQSPFPAKDRLNLSTCRTRREKKEASLFDLSLKEISADGFQVNPEVINPSLVEALQKRNGGRRRKKRKTMEIPPLTSWSSLLHVEKQPGPNSRARNEWHTTSSFRIICVSDVWHGAGDRGVKYPACVKSAMSVRVGDGVRKSASGLDWKPRALSSYKIMWTIWPQVISER